MTIHGRWCVLSLLLLNLAPVDARADEPRPVTRGWLLYLAHCHRCHGERGYDPNRPNVKSLVDVTERLRPDEILLIGKNFTGVTFGAVDGDALIAFLGTLQSDSYARPEMLVNTAWVAAYGRDAGVRVVDVRSQAAYDAGHIPGAVRVDDGPLRDPADPNTYLPQPETFAAMIGAAGIGNETHVVIYDDQGGRIAAHLWYVLNAYGHERVSLANGGWNRWKAEKRTVETTAPAPRMATFTPRLTPTLTCSSTELLARKPGVVVLDTRSPEEFQGARTSPGATKPGRIPGAVNVDWRQNVTGPEMSFKPAAELKQLYESLGITPDKEIVTYCASGVRAAQTLFTLRLLGYPRVRIYYGSFSDYTARPEAPVEK